LDDHFISEFHLTDKLKNNQKIKIKFFCGSNSYKNQLHLNPSYWVLKSWYKRHGSNNHKIEWLPAEFNNDRLNISTLDNKLKKEQPDIICFSIYLWNHEIYDRLGRFIKEKYPHIIMIGGGAQVYAHKDLSLFWKNYPWLDCAVYGDGEDSFRILVDSIIDSSAVNDVATNLSFMRSNQAILKPFKRFKDKDFKKVSHFLDNKQEIIESVRDLRKEDPNLEIIANYERVKGCPYKCTFCDWSSGLHNKLNIKEHDWKQDLDFLSSIDVSPRLVDANLGMFKEDIEVVKYIIDLERSNPNIKSLAYGNQAKLHKKAVMEIIDIIEAARPGERSHTFSIQDINEDVLLNIDRPDIPWIELKEMIQSLKDKHDTFRFKIEVMLGLPGQTIQNFANMLNEFTHLQPRGMIGHIWDLLINSPAYDKDYQKKYGLRIEQAMHVRSLPSGISNKQDILDKIDGVIGYGSDVILGTSTATIADIMSMVSMVWTFDSLLSKDRRFSDKIFSKLFNNLDFWQTLGDELAQDLEADKARYGKMILAVSDRGRVRTYADYFSDKEILTKVIQGTYKV